MSQYDFNPDLTIPVERNLDLRLITLANDAQLLAVEMANQHHLMPWVPWVRDLTPASHRQITVENLVAHMLGGAYPMAIHLHGEPVGSVDIRHIGRSHEDAELGYWIAADVQGRGIATKAARALIDFVRGRHNLTRLVLHTMSTNEASKKLASRLGFVPDGIVEYKDQAVPDIRYVREFQ